MPVYPGALLLRRHVDRLVRARPGSAPPLPAHRDLAFTAAGNHFELPRGRRARRRRHRPMRPCSMTSASPSSPSL